MTIKINCENEIILNAQRLRQKLRNNKLLNFLRRVHTLINDFMTLSELFASVDTIE